MGGFNLVLLLFAIMAFILYMLDSKLVAIVVTIAVFYYMDDIVKFAIKIDTDDRRKRFLKRKNKKV